VLGLKPQKLTKRYVKSVLELTGASAWGLSPECLALSSYKYILPVDGTTSSPSIKLQNCKTFKYWFIPCGVTIAGFKNRRRKNPPIREVIFVSETSGYFSYKKMGENYKKV